MTEQRSLTDVIAGVSGDGPQTLRELRNRASSEDPRAAVLPIHALEALLEADDRFRSEGGLWSLTADAPVAGVSVHSVTELPDAVSSPESPISEMVFLDVEATDPEPTRANLIEIGAILVTNWDVVATFETFVHAPELPHSITALTGITPQDLKTAPDSASAVSELRQFIGDRPIVGQNIRYDIEILRNIDRGFDPETVLDCLDLAHIVFPAASGRTLGDLAEQFGIEPGGHRALSDCHTTLAVAKRLTEELGGNSDLANLIRHVLSANGHIWSRVLEDSRMPDVDPSTVRSSGAPWLTRSFGDEPRAPTAEEAFGPEGLLTEVLRSADFRPAQLDLSVEVETALAAGKRLLVEAPTGTGKTYAYLVPAVRTSQAKGKPVWVSTDTKTLQTQLQGDFADLKENGVVSGDLAVLKGKDNYLCTRDLLAAVEVDLAPEAAVEVATQLSLLWTSEEGEINESTDYWLTSRYPEAAQIRETLTLNPATCEQRACEFIAVCPYFTAWDNAQQASVVAVNHALLISAFDELNESKIAALIVDEAHTLEDVATSVTTMDLDPRTVVHWLNQLINPESSSGLLRNLGRAFGFAARQDIHFASALDGVRRARKAIQLFSERMAAYLAEFVGRPDFGDYPINHRFRIGIDDRRYLFLEARQALFTFAELTKELVAALNRLHQESADRTAGDGHNKNALRRRLRAEAARADELVDLALSLLTISDDQFVVYATWEASESTPPAIAVSKAPLDVSGVLRHVYSKAPSVIGTSATLSTGGTFDFIKERLAADDFATLQVPETFDYASQASLVLTRHLPVPSRANENEFVDAVAETAVAAIGTSQGGTLCLFTSRKRLISAFKQAEAPVRYEGLDVRAQLPGVSMRELSGWFREAADGSLFGLRSFWQGFDAPGDTLRLLLIEKLPFPSPADPLFGARSDLIEGSGRDPFYEYALPTTALALKQGFGRLIRTRQDQGVVAILDRRVRTGLSYQAALLESLPANIPIEYPADENDFLEILAEALGKEPRLDLANGVGPQRSIFHLEETTISDPTDTAQVTKALGSILNQFRVDAFRPGQEELIRAVVVEKRDVAALLPTGAGKSLIFQAASMAMDGTGIVVSPLIALMRDQVDGLRNELGFRWAYALYGGQTGAERDEILDAVRGGGCRLLYVSPERLRDPALLRTLAEANITFVAVDEAHCVSVWGHHFRPDFLSIVPSLAQLPNTIDAPRIALTATAPQAVFDDIVEQLDLRKPVVERASADRPNIHFSVIKCRNKKQKRSELLRVAIAHEGQSGIVYCPTRYDTEATAALLQSHGITARHYHAGMPPEQRQAVQEMFMSDQVPVICATNAFGLGIDKPDIGFVAHWALPLSLDAYFQEAGRAGRDPRTTGRAILLWAPSDLTLLRKMASTSLPTIEDLESLETEIGAMPHPYATVEELSDRTELDEVATRVGVHLLQRAGAITQAPDVASRALVAIPASQQRIRERFGDVIADETSALASASGLSMPGRGVLDLINLSSRVETDPAGLEARLLSLAEAEVVGYRPFLRAMSLHSAESSWDRSAIDDFLSGLRRSAFDRLESMRIYADGKTCRRQRLLAHFDEKASARCGFCDVCSGLPPHLTQVNPMRYADVDVVTGGVAQAITGIVGEASRLGSAPGRRSFVQGLKGTSRWAAYETPQVLQRSRWFGALRYLTDSEIETAIDSMIQDRKILAVEHTLSSGGTYIGLDVRVR